MLASCAAVCPQTLGPHFQGSPSMRPCQQEPQHHQCRSTKPCMSGPSLWSWRLTHQQLLLLAPQKHHTVWGSHCTCQTAVKVACAHALVLALQPGGVAAGSPA